MKTLLKKFSLFEKFELKNKQKTLLANISRLSFDSKFKAINLVIFLIENNSNCISMMIENNYRKKSFK